MAVVGPLLLAAIWYLDGRFDARRDTFDFVGLPVILVWVSYRGLQRERKNWDSLALDLRGDSLIRRLPDYPPLEISPNDVTKIVESSHGLTIRTTSRQKTLLVSEGLLEYDEFRARLLAWAPTAKVVHPPSSVLTSITALATCLFCTAMFGTPLYLLMYVPQKLVLPVGIAITACFLLAILYYQRSPHVPVSTRKMAWILLLFPILGLVARLH
jgi:hypothetical protein